MSIKGHDVCHLWMQRLLIRANGFPRFFVRTAFVGAMCKEGGMGARLQPQSHLSSVKKTRRLCFIRWWSLCKIVVICLQRRKRSRPPSYVTGSTDALEQHVHLQPPAQQLPSPHNYIMFEYWGYHQNVHVHQLI